MQETLLHSFWRVITLPFRAIAFVFRRISTIPIKNLILMTVIFLVLLALTAVIFVELTSQPAFCVTCHYSLEVFQQAPL